MSLAAKLRASGLIPPRPWNIARAEYVRGLSGFLDSTRGTARSVFFKPEGIQMYVLDQAEFVNEYRLSTPWNVTSAVYVRNFSVTPRETLPTGLFFKPDGTRMYVCGADNIGEITEYSLSDPWDVTSAVFTRDRSVASVGNTRIPGGVFFKPDGTKAYFTNNISGSSLRVDEYSLSGPWNVSTLTFDRRIAISVPGEVFDPRDDLNGSDLFFKPDGTKMYFVRGVDRFSASVPMYVLEFSLSNPWNISSAVLAKKLSVDDREARPEGVFFHPEGTRMYVSGYKASGVNSASVSEYRLSNDERSTGFASAGTHVFTVPNTVTSVNISLGGGAGGGASGWSSAGVSRNGGSGGSAASATKVLSVTPGEALTVFVGSGGAGGNAPGIANVASGAGFDGTDSTVTQAAVVVARADAGSGAPGQLGSSDGAGGVASASIGDTKTDGTAGGGGVGGLGHLQDGSDGIAGFVAISWL